MSTDTTANLTKQLVTVALTTANKAGTTLQSLIGTRLYIDRPPDNAAYPFVILRLYGWRTDPNFDNTRATATLECTVMARPRTTAQLAEQIADVLVQAFAQFRAATSGLVFTTGYTRDTMPTFPAPADSDVVQIRVTASLVIWPVLTIVG